MAYNDKGEQQVWRPQGGQSAEVSNKIVLPEVEDNSAKLLQESTPQGVPVVSNMDKARIRYNASPGNAIMNDIDVRNTLDNAKTSALKEYDEDKAQRDKEAKEKADAEAQEAEEAKHRKAEKMWSAIGDGISAIANMATVGAGADSMYNPADSLHSKVKSKWDEIKANKAAVAAANRKAQMDLLLKEYELGVKSKEAEANRNFNIWKTETEEAGRNQRAKEEQEFKASEGQKNRDNDKEVAKIRGKYSRSSGGGSGGSSKHEFLGKSYPSANARNQAILDKANELGVPTHDAEKRPRRYADVEYDIRKKLATP